MGILQLERVDFDCSENRNPLIKNIVGIFVDDENLTAYGKIDNWLKSTPSTRPYLGWDGKIYPQFNIIIDKTK